MKHYKKTKYVHEGQYAAAVEVSLVDDGGDWSPCLSTEDAYKLDDVREALRKGDLQKAAKNARVYEMKPLVPH